MRREQEEALSQGIKVNFLRLLIAPLLAAALLLTAAGVYTAAVATTAQKERSAHPKKPVAFQYVCPMHEDVKSKTPAKCPKCKMKLEKRQIIKS
jgi:hypothetical protein